MKYEVFWNILQAACNNYTKEFKCRSWMGTPTLSRLFLGLIIFLIYLCLISVFFLITFLTLYKFNRDVFQVLRPWILNLFLSCLFVFIFWDSGVAWWQSLHFHSSWQALLVLGIWKKQLTNISGSDLNVTVWKCQYHEGQDLQAKIFLKVSEAIKKEK